MESRENGSNMLATHVYIDVDGEIFEFMNDLEFQTDLLLPSLLVGSLH